MIAARDTLSLAPGVTVAQGRLTDAVRGASWPLNASGAFVLARTGAPVGLIVRELADAFSLSDEAARADVLRFVWNLNALALVNVESGRVARAATGRLDPAGGTARSGWCAAGGCHTPARDRHPSVRRAFGSCLTAISARVGVVAGVGTAVAAQLSLLAGASGLIVPLTLGLGTGVGLGFHEAAHAASLRGVPSALVTRGRRTYVLHAAVSPSRRSIVALAGPLAAARPGHRARGRRTIVVAPALAIAGCPLAAHALALTVVGGDGRVACGL